MAKRPIIVIDSDRADDGRIELRDRIAAKMYDRSGQSLNASDWLNDWDCQQLADAVMELFVHVSHDPWLRSGYVIAELTSQKNPEES